MDMEMSPFWCHLRHFEEVLFLDCPESAFSQQSVLALLSCL